MRTRFLKLTVLVLAGVGGALFVAERVVHSQQFKSLLQNSKHDFRVASPSDIRSTTENESCIFCHTPHVASSIAPLWNHAESTEAAGTVYTSTTMQATTSLPTAADSSKLCLACHDGTVALGETLNDGVIPFIQGTNYMLPPTSSSNVYKGTGFSDDHPFAFVPVTGSEIQNPGAGDPVKLDAAGKVQCVSCHDPHAEAVDPTARKFLVKSNVRSELCLTCHTKTGWLTSSHRQPASGTNDARYTSAQGAHTGYTGVSNNACESCHRPHSPLVNQRLGKFAEEETCYKCHDGSVAETTRNIQSAFQTATYSHPVSTTPSVHEASEGPGSAMYRLPETSAGAARHAECVDCHSPHEANPQTVSPPQISGYLTGVPGITETGSEILRSQYEYQVCFKCHGDSANKPQSPDTGIFGIGYGRNPQRVTDQANPNRFNTRIEFASTVAWHPVTRPRGLTTGPGGENPSLRPYVIDSTGQPILSRPLSATSLIYCIDCHNSDTGRNLGTGNLPMGVHGSDIAHLLERTYSYNIPPATPGDPFTEVPYSVSAYALCDKCHDVANGVVGNLGFSKHTRHVASVQASCSVCHDAHGINGGNTTNNKAMVNFDLSIVGPDRNGILRYESTGFQQGRCYLTCHGMNHSPKSYR